MKEALVSFFALVALYFPLATVSALLFGGGREWRSGLAADKKRAPVSGGVERV